MGSINTVKTVSHNLKTTFLLVNHEYHPSEQLSTLNDSKLNAYLDYDFHEHSGFEHKKHMYMILMLIPSLQQ